ncbi:LysR family transcriptional regulator [Anaeromyxobacter paludicola]|uniref:LysR family transcriptional regulator n=1 Tax=Anaeromyxobacter paludicola TaxID=2918171 RepID=A0ABM7XA07_9BACT|nr:LysR family transcriptional regulator [Anaeromyxobacter paludicola]BDG08667.1 LysR family transcriptional regulator [Anaeromyxobacter paludicola]
MTDDWDHLRFFLAVARAGTLSAAATTLGVSQPTVSRRIAALAERFGTALLRRDGSRYVLTGAGASVLARAERIDREVLAVSRAVDRLDAQPHGSVRLSVPDGLGLALVAPALDDFRREHPGIDLLLHAEAEIVNLSRSEADLALRFVRPRQRELVMRRVGSIPFRPYASPRYLASRPRERGGPPVLPGDDLVAFPEAMAGAPQSVWLRRHGAPGRVRVRVRSSVPMKAALLAGAGIGLLPDYLGDDPGLVPLTAEPVMRREVWLVFHRALKDVARVRAVARFAAELLRPWR